MTGALARRILLGVALLALVAAPWLLSPYPLGLLTEILIFAVFAGSLNVLLGYTGLVSLGHAAFFGVGAYAAGLAAIHWSPSLFVTLPAALVAALVAAVGIGLFVARAAGFFFLMLTLAFAQMVYAVALRWSSLTGGSNGLAGIPRPVLWGEVALYDPAELYLLVLVVSVLVFWIIQRFIASPVGQTLVGIRENEARVRAVGYDTTRYKLLSFAIAGALGGVAGALYAYFNGFVSPEDLYWTMSGHVLIMLVVGGAGTLAGPLLGAAFLILLESWVSSYTDRWFSVVGAVFIAVVLFAPRGLSGLLQRLRAMSGRRARGEVLRTEGVRP